MRRTALAITLAAAVLVTAACHSSDPIYTSDGTQVHWQQTSATTLERQINVNVPSALTSDAVFMNGIRHGIAQVDRSPYVDMVLQIVAAAPTDCPDRHCVNIYRQPMNGAVTSWGWDSRGHMFGRAATIGFDNGPWDQATINNAACHELYHALSLLHSSDGSQGPCVGGTATDHDLQLVANGHNHKDAHLYPDTKTTGKIKITKRHAHSRSFYEALSHGANLPQQVLDRAA
jgi:hypothetical protein